MPTIRRADGAQFVIQTYRETLNIPKPSLLKSEVRMLAQNHGQYVKLFKQNQKHTEAVFSTDPGYLLAETVWQYFGKPPDFIYCETLHEKNYALVVVIKNTNVYLDAKIPFSSIADEFTPLVTNGNQYDIYIAGDVPISNVPIRGKFIFENSMVKSFNRLDQGVLDVLPTDRALQLQPIEMALRSLQTKKISPSTIAMLTLVVLVLILLWYFLRPKPAPVVVPTQLAPTAPPVNPYFAFQNALTSPAPLQQLSGIANIVKKLYGMPGWMPTNIQFNDSSFKINVITIGGDLSALQAWANANHIQMSIQDTGNAALSLSMQFSNRAALQTIPDLQNVIITLLDRMNHLFVKPSIRLGTITSTDLTKQASVTVTFSQISPAILVLIGDELTDLPIKLKNVTLSFEQNLLSGTIQLDVLGK